MTTFRERAAIALFTIPCTETQDGFDAGSAAHFAQDLADACCAKWGHDVRAVQPLEIGAATIGLRDLNRLPAHTECARCGKRETKS